MLNDSDSDDEKAPAQSLAHTKDADDEKKSASPTKLATLMSKKEELVLAKEKIQTNIDSSKKALTNHEAHVKELKEIIKSQPSGAAKQELVKVLENAKNHVSDLEDHIKQGEKLIEVKETSIDQIESKLDKTNDADVGQAKMIQKSTRDKKKAEERQFEKTIEDGAPAQLEDQRTKALQKVDENSHKAKLLEEEAKDLKPEVAKAES